MGSRSDAVFLRVPSPLFTVTVNVGVIAGSVVGGLILLVILGFLFYKSQKAQLFLARGVESVDRTLSELDENTKPYKQSRAHLPQTIMLVLSAILLQVGMFTNSVVVCV